MEKVYAFNPESCSYEEVKKPYMMHNLLLLTLMFTSVLFFLLSCYYHAENQKTLELAPVVAKNCYTELESIKSELTKQREHYQMLSNTMFIMRNAAIHQPPLVPAPASEIHNDLAFYQEYNARNTDGK
jgi:hypothetical protein